MLFWASGCRADTETVILQELACVGNDRIWFCEWAGFKPDDTGLAGTGMETEAGNLEMLFNLTHLN